jgi:formiminotetrahydrofolate cyclodeaminase
MYLRKSLKDFLEDLSSKSPSPGGGAVSALVLALGIALLEMVANFSLGPRFIKVHRQIKKSLSQLNRLHKMALELVDEDIISYKRWSANKNKENLIKATEVPFKVCLLSEKVASLAERLAKIANPYLITDTGIASLLAETAFISASLNLRINLKSLKDKRFLQRIDKLLQKKTYLKKSREEVLKRVDRVIGGTESSSKD